MGYFSEADIDIRMPETDDGDGVKEINFFAAMAEIDSPIKVAESTPSEQKHVEQKPKEIARALDLSVKQVDNYLYRSKQKLRHSMTVY